MNLLKRINKLALKLEKALLLISELTASNTKLTASNAELSASNTELSGVVAAQKLQIDSLQSLLDAKSIRKTSQNSHQSPSTDLARKNQSLREKSTNPSGGQLGHKGHSLSMSKSPDVVIELHPSQCSECGSSLDGLVGQVFDRRQVIDIPPITPVTTEYQSLMVKCSCGHCQAASFPEGVNSNIQYGPNIQSLVVYQSAYQYLPLKRLQGFFKEVCSVSISQGTIENILRRTAEKAKSAYEALREQVASSSFIGSDETGSKSNMKKLWFWVWQNETLTFIVGTDSRAKKVIEENFPNGLPDTIVCSDRLAAQLSTLSKGKQICIAHLFRDLNYLEELEGAPWPTQLKTLLKDAIELKRQQSQYNQNDKEVLDIEERAGILLETVMSEIKKEELKTKTFFGQIIRLRDALFTFLYHAEVPPDNNGSERAIRLIKIKTKISGQFKSMYQEFAILRSVIDTAVKNNKEVFQEIRNIVDLPCPQRTG